MHSFFENPPLLHSWDRGATWNTGGFTGDALKEMAECIARSVNPPARICETGAGNSTIAFLLCEPAQLTSIAPDVALFGRINDYCDGNSVDRRAWRAIDGHSEWELPPLARQEAEAETWFDVALLDGAHGWPTVFVDFCYMHAMVRRGGLIIVDDVQLYSAKELARFLSEDAKFTQVLSLMDGKTLIFRKDHEARLLPDFGAQPYIKRKTGQQPSTDLSYICGYLTKLRSAGIATCFIFLHISAFCEKPTPTFSQRALRPWSQQIKKAGL